MSITALDSRPYYTRAVDVCDRLINKHLEHIEASHPDPLKACGLTRDEVKRMTRGLSLEDRIEDYLKLHTSVTAKTLGAFVDVNTIHLGRIIKRMIDHGKPIEVGIFYDGNNETRNYTWKKS